MAEFEIAMAERQLKAKELEKSMQRYTAPRMKTYTLPYVLDDAQLKMANSRFPRTIFKCAQDNGHDHPLAHLETMIAADQAARMFPAGSLVLDLWGSPKRCSDLNRGQARSNNPKTFHAYVSIMVEKDNLRALAWPQAEPQDWTEGETGNIFTDLMWDEAAKEFNFFPLYDGVTLDFMSIHTLYYMTDEDIAKILSVRGSRMIAVVHRHMADQGTMFAGEATYAKIHGCVEQINTQTGERYVHRDLSFLWQSRTKVVHVADAAYTWTMHKVTDETWIIVLTGCVSRDERFAKRKAVLGANGAANEVNESALAPTHFPHPALAELPTSTCTLVGGVPVIRVKGAQIPDVRLSCPKMLEYLKSHIVGKPRDSVRLQDLFSLARTHVADGSNFAGKQNFECPADEIAGHVILAYLSGVKSEMELLRAASAYHTFTREHNALLDMSAVVYDGSAVTTGRTAVGVAKRLNEARKKGDLFSAAIDVFDS